MYSNSDFKRFFIRYKAEAFLAGESIQKFCLRNKIPYNLFEKWYKDTRHKIVPVQVESATQPKLRWSKTPGREVGGFMLSINGLKQFYYLRDFHDMSYNISSE